MNPSIIPPFDLRPEPDSNEDIVQRLEKLDNSARVELTQFEAGFMESILSRKDKGNTFLTERQREVALRILDTYQY